MAGGLQTFVPGGVELTARLGSLNNTTCKNRKKRYGDNGAERRAQMCESQYSSILQLQLLLNHKRPGDKNLNIKIITYISHIGLL